MIHNNDNVPALAVGAILASSWGYDQTNVDFYRVEKVKNGWATLQQIAGDETGDGWTGKVVPAEPHRLIEQPFRRKLGESMGEPIIRISSYEYARPWDGRPKSVTHYA